MRRHLGEGEKVHWVQVEGGYRSGLCSFYLDSIERFWSVGEKKNKGSTLVYHNLLRTNP